MTRQIIHALLLTTITIVPAGAQGLDAEGAIDTIIGSEVSEQETTATADPAKVMSAIDKAGENADKVRKLTQANRVEIVFLSDSTASEGGPPPEIEAKLKERDAEVTQLRKELEGNALLYYAIDSRQVLMRDVLAIEIGDDQTVMIYAAAKPAG
jgi:preprotein translocase subunit SecF